ncbi:hypothetical protein PG994_005239 [Apiospora phragmitis]|uniref:Uncharacterized protein n=1 Tax=Apiospora phragmitis TaxID=2905665 RepID=A0ABR1VSU7_9PEZI
MTSSLFELVGEPPHSQWRLAVEAVATLQPPDPAERVRLQSSDGGGGGGDAISFIFPTTYMYPPATHTWGYSHLLPACFLAAAAASAAAAAAASVDHI